MLAAKQPLAVPMLLRLSHFKLNSYVVLVVSKQKGITLVFKTDPLQNVDINSTFDSIAVIQKFIQREIEGQLRQMFREDLPGIIHRLSQQWVKAKVEAPYLEKQPPPVTSHPLETRSMYDISLAASDAGLHSQPSPTSLRYRRPRSTSGLSKSSVGRHTTPPAIKFKETLPSPNPATYESDLEHFDPTYGLRPEGLPTKSVFRGFSSLFSPIRGLADLAEEQEPSEPDGEDYDEDDDTAASFDFIHWQYAVSDSERESRTHPPPSVVHDTMENVPEYETIPAVGGGTVTRPRVYHSQSMIHLPAPGPVSSSAQSIPPTLHTPSHGFTTPSLHSGTSSTFAAGLHPHPIHHTRYLSSHTVTSAPASSSYFPTSYTPPLHRSFTPDSLETQPSQSSSGYGQTPSTPPTSDPRDDDDAAIYIRHRRSSISSVTTNNANANLDSAFSSPPTNIPDPKIVLRPSLNNSIHQLSTLSHSNHTLSPYTRSLEHFTVRSGPPRSAGVNSGGFGGSPGERQQPVKARRKRTFHIGGGGGKGKVLQTGDERGTETRPGPPSMPGPDMPHPYMPSEFDMGDMDRYFRSFDEHDNHDILQHLSPPRKTVSTFGTLRRRLPPAPHLQQLHNQKYDLHPR